MDQFKQGNFRTFDGDSLPGLLGVHNCGPGIAVSNNPADIYGIGRKNSYYGQCGVGGGILRTIKIDRSTQDHTNYITERLRIHYSINGEFSEDAQVWGMYGIPGEWYLFPKRESLVTRYQRILDQSRLERLEDLHMKE